LTWLFCEEASFFTIFKTYRYSADSSVAVEKIPVKRSPFLTVIVEGRPYREVVSRFTNT
jgi:hypothetical protein